MRAAERTFSLSREISCAHQLQPIRNDCVKTEISPEQASGDFYRAAILILERAKIPFLVGGAYAFAVYTGIRRDTKDIDLFLRPRDVDLAIEAFCSAGYEAEKTFAHWLAKVKSGDDLIDLIFRAGNGLCEIDDSWFNRACPAEAIGMQVKLCAAEDILWMKAFIMERERYDGADVIHLLHACAKTMDWPHLLRRFGPDWQLLLSYLILFGYIYPSDASRIPVEVRDELFERLRIESRAAGAQRVCRGTLLSRAQYLVDVEERGYHDARLESRVQMGPAEIRDWTKAIGQ
jgi:hypothetical protein